MAGAAGKFLLSTLSLSPEILPPRYIYSKKSIYDFDVVDSSAGPIAECGNLYRFFITESVKNPNNKFLRSIPFSDMKTREEIFDYIDTNSSDFFREALSDDIFMLPMIGHYIYPGVTIFPNAKNIFVDVSDFPSKMFQMRARWEKVHRKITSDRTTIYQSFYENWFQPEKINGQYIDDYCNLDTGIKLNLWKIISGDIVEYTRLCSFLNITPSPEYTKFSNVYSSKQWKRINNHDKK